MCKTLTMLFHNPKLKYALLVFRSFWHRKRLLNFYFSKTNISKFCSSDNFKKYPAKFTEFFREMAKNSRSQYGQDIFVIYMYKFHLAEKFLSLREDLNFVEFGATDGVNLSNTLILERDYAWNGILVEPSKSWFRLLKKNRNCELDSRCVYSISGLQLEFTETTVGSLSTLKKYLEIDFHERRLSGESYFVETVSLDDLFLQHNTPKYIAYLSIDTEGSEWDIISNFNFESWNIGIITIEHNYTEVRNSIQKLLEAVGFVRVFSGISECDDWYVNTHIFENLELITG